VTDDLPGLDVWPTVGVVAKLAEPPRAAEPQVPREFQAGNLGIAYQQFSKPFPNITAPPGQDVSRGDLPGDEAKPKLN